MRPIHEQREIDYKEQRDLSIIDKRQIGRYDIELVSYVERNGDGQWRMNKRAH